MSTINIQGRPLTCPICGNNNFDESQAMLNTAGMTFLKLDWLNTSATTYTCTHCKHILWFNFDS